MTAPRERRRPGAAAPFPLAPNVEPIVPAATPTAAEETPPVQNAAPNVIPSAPPAARAQSRAPKTRNDVPADELPDKRVARTFQIRGSIIGAAQTAVLRTAGLDGGYSSLNALVEAAIERELTRLADELNHGHPYPPHTGKFRSGRPIGT